MMGSNVFKAIIDIVCSDEADPEIIKEALDECLFSFNEEYKNASGNDKANALAIIAEIKEAVIVSD